MSETYEYFRGDGSFVANSYAVFYEGRGGHGVNPDAIEEGRVKTSILTSNVSTHGNSAFSRLIEYLEQIQRRESEKEERYLRNKLNQMMATLPDEYYRKISAAIEAEDYNSAFTLVENCKKDLNDLREEISKKQFHSFQKTRSLYGSDFGRYVEEQLAMALQVEGDKLISTGSNISIESLVDGFIKKQLAGNDGILIHGLEQERQNFIDDLTKLFQERGILLQKWDSKRPLFTERKQKNFSSLAKGKAFYTKGGKTRSMNAILKGLANGLQKGIGMEIQAAANTVNSGAAAIMTGRMQRELLSVLEKETGNQVSQKGDVVSFELASGSIDISSIVQRVLQDNPDATLDNIREAITLAAPNLEIFEVAQNVKGYKSKFDLNIESEGSFDKRLANIEKIKGNSYFDRLSFMLVNTTEGCLLDKRTDEIGLYVAAAFAAYMWDDYDEIYSIRSAPSQITRLHLFNSGGAYFTASTLIQQTIDELKNNFGQDGISKRNTSSLFNVEIKPGPRYSESEYENLIDRYPLSSSTNVQETLKNRWDEVRASALKRGNLSIKVRQQELDKLLGNLEGIIMDL